MEISLRQSVKRDAKLLDLWKLIDDQEAFNFEAAMTVYEQDAKEMVSNDLFIVFDDSGEPVGFVGFYNYYDKKRRHGVRIYIAPNQRNKGYGTQLVEMLRFLAAEKNYSQIFAVICRDNDRSTKLFRHADNWRIDHQTAEKIYFSCRP